MKMLLDTRSTQYNAGWGKYCSVMFDMILIARIMLMATNQVTISRAIEARHEI